MKAAVRNMAPLPNGGNTSQEAASPQTALLTKSGSECFHLYLGSVA